MNLYRVGHWRPADQVDDEPRVAIVVAESDEQAVELCSAEPDADQYSRIEVIDSIEPAEGSKAVPNPPARVLGWEGGQPFNCRNARLESA